ncbi:ThuA domain-containing protein [Luteitalea sp.]|uniref:ThuA domain-containing protein n=1 Tax=Luteitalea sp. TaxID=2004800 RepID=UPI0025C21132|nr:ThuA domain-containing protein [Luteitalea sp.]
MQQFFIGLLATIVVAVTVVAQGPTRIKVMLLDGESGGPYHKWQLTTPLIERALEETGRFDVTVVTAPAATGVLDGFLPDFSAYQAVVFNYDAPDERWPAPLRTAFEQYVSSGGGAVVVHAADNAFSGWKAWNDMIGVGGWRGRTVASGPYWYYKDDTLVKDPSDGPGASHGRRTPYAIRTRVADHPITRGLPAVWMHQGDELYAHLRGPGTTMTILATAFADPANNGTGRDEPILMTSTFGKGRVFHTVLGHDIVAMSCVGFVVTLQRATEWAATGAVTQKVPTTFPTATTVSYRADLAALDPNYARGLNALDAPPK